MENNITKEVKIESITKGSPDYQEDYIDIQGDQIISTSDDLLPDNVSVSESEARTAIHDSLVVDGFDIGEAMLGLNGLARVDTVADRCTKSITDIVDKNKRGKRKELSEIDTTLKKEDNDKIQLKEDDDREL